MLPLFSPILSSKFMGLDSRRKDSFSINFFNLVSFIKSYFVAASKVAIV